MKPAATTRAVLARLGLEGTARSAWHAAQRLAPGMFRKPPSETSKCRLRLAPYCEGYGLDLGFGGDPIVPNAIRMDMPRPYSNVGVETVQLGGRAEDLRWFRDGTLDFVYSSHLLEDYVDTAAVLREWLRVLRPGGRLILFCPDEQVYRRHCARTGQPYNTAHVHAEFSLALVKHILTDLGETRILHENPLVDAYSWELVAEKTPTPGPAEFLSR